jgi:hypothetical protein
MRYRKRVLILLAIVILVSLLFQDYFNFHEDIMHIRSNNKEFKQKPEQSIESTILHGEREVYNYAFSYDH